MTLATDSNALFTKIKMNIQREDFLNNLEMVRAGLSPREFIEQSSCIVFQGGFAMTFNDEVACRVKVGVDITGAVQANALFDILGKLEDTELSIEENANGELEFIGKRKKFGITKDAEIFLPIDRVETPDKWKPLPKEFTEAVGLVQHCVSGDESKFLLTCIHLHPEYVEACDNFQIMRVELGMGLKSSVLVRGTSLKDLVTLAMTEVALTKSWIHFRNAAGLIYSCRRYSEDYPVLDTLLKSDGHPIVIPKGIAKASERAAVFAVDPSGESQVTVTLVPGKIRICGAGATGWYREVAKAAYDGPEMEFMISPTLLKQVSENHSEATISDNKLAVSGGHWKYVTVLSKAKAEKVEEEGEPADPKKGFRKKPMKQEEDAE